MEKTREQLIQSIKNTLQAVKSSTAVKGWTFKVEKKNYVILKYRNVLDYVDVYESTRQGRKLSTTPVVSLKNSVDENLAFEKAMEILVPNNQA